MRIIPIFGIVGVFCSLFSNICSLNTLNINNSITILSGELLIGGEWFESEFFFSFDCSFAHSLSLPICGH